MHLMKSTGNKEFEGFEKQAKNFWCTEYTDIGNGNI